MAMHCTKCGNPQHGDTKFCVNCGTPLSTSPGTTSHGFSGLKGSLGSKTFGPTSAPSANAPARSKSPVPPPTLAPPSAPPSAARPADPAATPRGATETAGPTKPQAWTPQQSDSGLPRTTSLPVATLSSTPDAPPRDELATDATRNSPAKRTRPERTIAQRRLLIATFVLCAVGLFIGGGLLGYRWSSSHTDPSVAAPLIPVATMPANFAATHPEPPAKMPDVVGLKPDQAKEALSDIGIDPSKIVVNEKPQVGTPGRVFQQTPVRGSSNPAQVTLTVSVAATVPSLAGKTYDDAANILDALGVVAVRSDTYQANAPLGTVLSTNPAPGTALTPAVTIAVAAQGSSVFANQLDADSSSDCSTPSSGKTAGGSGLQSANALLCSRSTLADPGDTQNPAITYLLGTRADRFTATIVLSDDGSAGDRARVRIVTNGSTEVFNQVVTFGAKIPVDVAITGAANFKIYVTSLTTDDEAWNDESVVFVDPTFYGSSKNIDALSN